MGSTRSVYDACKVADNLFVMNPYLPQQNFYSQQLRALALAQEIFDSHLSGEDRNVAVVGAGIAGRMLAAAFVSLNVGVTLVEKEKRPFHEYGNASHRELHPNIIFWPFEEPTPTTSLPFMNWGQSPASDVSKKWEAEWKSGFSRKVPILHKELVALDRTKEPLELHLTDDADLGLALLAAGGDPDLRRKNFGRFQEGQ